MHRILGVAWLFAWTALAADPEPARVKQARPRVEPPLRAMFAAAGVSYPPAELLLRGIKDERVLEVWAASSAGAPMKRVTTYPLCAFSGVLGPKRAMGDGQIPEGVYAVDRFNPWSAFHLSLGLDYPNAIDRLRKSADAPGGDIFIHGGCATIGCLPLGDEAIEALYVLAVDARAKGGRKIAVHLFPFRLTEERLAAVAADEPHRAFWNELRPVFAAFEATHRPPRVGIAPTTGAYVVKTSAAAVSARR